MEYLLLRSLKINRERSAKDISKRYDIVLAVEKFDCGGQKCVFIKIKYICIHALET